MIRLIKITTRKTDYHDVPPTLNWIKFSTMTVLITNDQEVCSINIDLLEKQATHVLAELDSSDKELSILVTDDASIQQLNKEYRDKDSATDVLSFPQFEEDDDHDDPEFPCNLLGDVVISIETATCQAKEHDLSTEEELILLLIHGILHLLGYDHERSASEAEAMQIKSRILFDKLYPGTIPSDTCGY
jgi:rRNA maturation RNase YbeY